MAETLAEELLLPEAVRQVLADVAATCEALRDSVERRLMRVNGYVAHEDLQEFATAVVGTVVETSRQLEKAQEQTAALRTELATLCSKRRRR
jgi:hypothetical protein